MSKQNRSRSKLAGRLGVAGISALICLPAGAFNPTPVLKLLCRRRCCIAQSPKRQQAPADVPKPGTSSPDISPGSTVNQV